MTALTAMPKYATYKDSGIEWLGEIPMHWQAIKMKYLFRDVSIKNKPNETLLSVTQNKGVVPRDWVENRMVMPSGNLESFKFIKKGDFAISLRSFEGGLEYCHHDGIVSPAYTVLKSSKPYLLDGYYRYLFKSHIFILELQTSIVGIREGKNISYDELRYSILPIPKEAEQTAIAHFLDHKTAQIDAAIAIKEQQIALLKERKQILIQQAVTKGVGFDFAQPTGSDRSLNTCTERSRSEVEGNNGVPMKNSGVEWIGEIPAHWEVKKLKYLAHQFMYGTSVDCNELDNGTPVLRIPNIDELNFNFDNLKYASLTKDETARYLLHSNDILIIRTNGNPALVGKSAIFKNNGSFMFASYLIRIRHKRNVEPDFLIRTLNSFSVRGALTYSARTSAGNYNLNTQALGDCYVAYPPKNEQVKILNYLENESVKFEQAIYLQIQQIEKLREYKTTLINSAVTGKIRVTPEMAAASA